MIEIELPDGTVAEFPDGTEPGVIEGALRERFPQQQAPANPDYSNEGRAYPTAQKTVSPTRRAFRQTLGPYGDLGADIAAGVGKYAVSMGKTAEDVIRGRSLFDQSPTVIDQAIAEKEGKPAKRGYLLDAIGLSKFADDQYNEAGPVAGVAKFAADALTAGRVAQGVTDNVVRALPNATRTVRGVVGGATGGAVGGGLPTPGEGETRAGNLVSGAAAGGAVGAGATGLSSAARYVSELFPNATSSMRRAAETLTRELGGPAQKESVDAVLANPRGLPMTTAAASQSPGLSQIENQVRRRVTAKERPKWERADDRTNAEAWRRFDQATGRRAETAPLSEAQRIDMDLAQSNLDMVPLDPAQGQALAQDLMDLANTPQFQQFAGARAELNRLAGSLGRDTTLGGLARFDAEAASIPGFNAGQAAGLRSLLQRHLDDATGGYWTQTLNDYRAQGVDIDEARAAGDAYRNFMGDSGVVRGKTGNELPRVTSQRVRDSVNRQVEGSGTLQARDRLNPMDRGALDDLSRDLQQAEFPGTIKGGASFRTGSLADRLGDAPPGSWTGRGIRAALRTVTGRRDDAEMRAIEMALRSPSGWNKVHDMASNDISASDAALLARILRGSSAAGAAQVKE